MELPAQVREQVAEANRIAAAMAAEQGLDEDGNPIDASAVTASDEAGDESGTETGEVAESISDGTPNDTRFAESPDITDVTEETVTEEPSAEEITDTGEDYAHKYKTLQGMYNSEKRRAAELVGRIEGLESMLARLQEVRDTQAAAPEPVTETDKPLVTEEEIEEYGSDLISVMKRAAREAVQDEFEALKAENQSLKAVIGGVGQKQEMSEREKFYSTLKSEVPSWEKLNDEPGFLQWLDDEDVYAGEPRKALLHRAYEQNDANRVARFFTGYMNENAAVQDATIQAQPQSTEKAAGKGKVSLESLAAPGIGNSGSADNTGQSSGQQWKESDIGAFYEASRQGAYKGREDEYRRTEQQIQAAMNEGRILLGQ
jgi:hypothetical protein